MSGVFGAVVSLLVFAARLVSFPFPGVVVLFFAAAALTGLAIVSRFTWARRDVVVGAEVGTLVGGIGLFIDATGLVLLLASALSALAATILGPTVGQRTQQPMPTPAPQAQAAPGPAVVQSGVPPPVPTQPVPPPPTPASPSPAAPASAQEPGTAQPRISALRASGIVIASLILGGFVALLTFFALIMSQMRDAWVDYTPFSIGLGLTGIVPLLLLAFVARGQTRRSLVLAPAEVGTVLIGFVSMQGHEWGLSILTMIIAGVLVLLAVIVSHGVGSLQMRPPSAFRGHVRNVQSRVEWNSRRGHVEATAFRLEQLDTQGNLVALVPVVLWALSQGIVAENDEVIIQGKQRPGEPFHATIVQNLTTGETSWEGMRGF